MHDGLVHYDADAGVFVLRVYAANGAFIARREFEPTQWFNGGEPAIPDALEAECKRRRLRSVSMC
jgi:hypothetical protein